DQGAVVADQLAIERDAAAITFLHHLTGELHPRPQENEALRMGLGWGEAVVTEQVGVDFDTTTVDDALRDIEEPHQRGGDIRGAQNWRHCCGVPRRHRHRSSEDTWIPSDTDLYGHGLFGQPGCGGGDFEPKRPILLRVHQRRCVDAELEWHLSDTEVDSRQARLVTVGRVEHEVCTVLTLRE